MNETIFCCATITNEPLSDFTIQLLATLIGVGFGFWLPILYGKYKEKEEKEKSKKHLIDSVIMELVITKKGLADDEISKTKWNDEKQTFVGSYGMASVPIIHSALSTGSINLLDHELRETLVRISERVDHYNWFIKQMLTFYTTPIFATGKGKDEAEDLLHRTKHQSDKLMDHIDIVLKHITNEEKIANIEKNIQSSSQKS